MPSELEELVTFLHDPQKGIVQIALDHLVGYSQGSNQQIFAYDNYRAITDLKVLARAKVKKDVEQSVTILANLCDDIKMRDLIAEDDDFVNFLVFQICNILNPNADLMCILLANLAKNDNIIKVLHMTQDRILNDTEKIFKSKNAMDCLMDCFVKGFDRSLNDYADYDYLAYFFADISRHLKGREYFITEQEYDGIVPISKVLVFTEKFDDRVRREGVASTIKNSLFDSHAHMRLLSDSKINILPYILLPLAGPEDLDEEDMFNLPEELQLLPSDKKREHIKEILMIHLESLLLLCTTRPARENLRSKSVYSLIRETHKSLNDEDVADLCDRLVQLLMRDEAEDANNDVEIQEIEEESDDDEEIIEVL